jgi:hypothetical protein
MKKIITTFAIFIVLLSGCITPTEEQEDIARPNPQESVVYLIYSPICPHCHHMIEYLQTFENEIKIVKTTDSSKYANYLLERFNFSWDRGVPLLFGIVENKTLIVIEGYPAEQQEKDGYFLGKEKEQEICEKLKGEKVFVNGDYRFCRLPNGIIMGNKYAVDYLINICKTKGCSAIY